VLAAVALSGCATAGLADNGSEVTVPSGSTVVINSQTDGIWVSGTGEITVTPDVAILRVGVEAQAETVAEAQAQAQTAMAAVMTALDDSGVAASDIQTDYFNIRQRTRWDEETMEEVIAGYRVTNTVIAKVRDVEEVGAVIDAVVTAGGDLVRISSIDFSVDDPEAYYAEVRELAMAEAADKAEQLADLAGLTLGKATYISEGAVSPIYRSTYYDMGGMVAPTEATSSVVPAPIIIEEPSISPGELEISLTVQVAYSVLN
jgi:uncharacterized protein YggE